MLKREVKTNLNFQRFGNLKGSTVTLDIQNPNGTPVYIFSIRYKHFRYGHIPPYYIRVYNPEIDQWYQVERQYSEKTSTSHRHLLYTVACAHTKIVNVHMCDTMSFKVQKLKCPLSIVAKCKIVFNKEIIEDFIDDNNCGACD